MIIRKPYAFLIKNFRKIHIFLLILSLYITYKLVDVSGFVNEFMSLGIYDLFKDPVNKHITFLLTLSVFVSFVGSVSLLLLLHYKKKPWKIYLVPVITNLSLLFVLNMIKSFFGGYSLGVETTDLRMSRDLLMMFILVQLPVIGIYVMRVFGLDVKKFNFNSDKEFLELSEEDREEIEIGFSVDKNTFIRLYRKVLRNIGYFYQEHKNICKAIIGIFIVVVGFNFYKFVFVTHRTYKEGDFYSANGYTFKVNNVYFTNKDGSGKLIEKKSNFVVVDLTIVNNSQPRTIYLENFHLKNNVEDYITTRKIYANEFKDFGNTYDSTNELKRDETLDCIIIYKVDEKLNKNRFVLYYQEDNYLRKIKLKIKDVSKIKEAINLKLGDELDLEFKNKSDVIYIEDAEIIEEASYHTRKKTTEGSSINENKLVIDGDYRILRIDFSSELWEAKNMIDFLDNYGKLIYKDSEGVEDTLDIVNPISKTYYGKSVYLKVPGELENAKEISLDLVVRDKHYIYKII